MVVWWWRCLDTNRSRELGWFWYRGNKDTPSESDSVTPGTHSPGEMRLLLPNLVVRTQTQAHIILTSRPKEVTH